MLPANSVLLAIKSQGASEGQTGFGNLHVGDFKLFVNRNSLYSEFAAHGSCSSANYFKRSSWERINSKEVVGHQVTH